jgi:hypothetical protein
VCSLVASAELLSAGRTTGLSTRAGRTYPWRPDRPSLRHQPQRLAHDLRSNARDLYARRIDDVREPWVGYGWVAAATQLPARDRLHPADCVDGLAKRRLELSEKILMAAQTKKATEPSFDSFKRAPAAQRSEPRERSDLEWLPFVDTYRTLCAAPDSVFRKVLLEAR